MMSSKDFDDMVTFSLVPPGHFTLRVKFLDHYGMDYHESWFRHSLVYIQMC